MPAAPAGYSGKALWRKLGLQEAQRLLVIEPPAHLADLLEGAPDSVRRLPRLAEFDIALVFAATRKTLNAELHRVLPKLAYGGMIWIAWPKRASGVATDVTEDAVRTIALPLGIVDVKVCAIDATWSGLKFVRRRVPQ